VRVIVDTPVWSAALRRRRKNLSTRERSLVLYLRELIINGDAILLGSVRQELLTGIIDPDAFKLTRQRLRALDDLAPDTDDYERAAEYANQCARHGIAATTIAMLICAVAVGRGVRILTTDNDFARYAQWVPIRLHPLP
jgi:predicted nucleic acid-binding protein